TQSKRAGGGRHVVVDAQTVGTGQADVGAAESAGRGQRGSRTEREIAGSGVDRAGGEGQCRPGDQAQRLVARAGERGHVQRVDVAHADGATGHADVVEVIGRLCQRDAAGAGGRGGGQGGTDAARGLVDR